MSFLSLSELRTKSEPELQRLIAQTRAQLARLRSQAANGSLRNVREIRHSRRLLAQALTLGRGLAFRPKK